MAEPDNLRAIRSGTVSGSCHLMRGTFMCYSLALSSALIQATTDHPVAQFPFAQFLHIVRGDCHVDASDEEATGAAEVLRKMAPISPRDRGHISPSICRDPLSRLYHRRKTLRNHFVIHSEPPPAHPGMWRHIAAQFVQHEGLRMVLNPLVEEVERTVCGTGAPHPFVCAMASFIASWEANAGFNAMGTPRSTEIPRMYCRTAV